MVTVISAATFGAPGISFALPIKAAAAPYCNPAFMCRSANRFPRSRPSTPRSATVHGRCIR
jgi:hypothetical protein